MMRRTVTVGGSWGVLCGIANGWPVASTLVQMTVPWVWIAALVGYRLAESTRRSGLLGGVALAAASVAYFGVGAIAGGLSGESPFGGIRFLILWTSIALVVGPIAGVIGRWLTTERTVLAVVLLATVSIAEPLALWAHIDHLDAHFAYFGVALIGLTFPVVWFRSALRNAVKAVALTVALTYPTAVILEAGLVALRQISSPLRLV